MEEYSLNPHRISIDRFFQLTRNKQLIPSREALSDQMEERFGQLKELGIKNLGELLKRLKSKQELSSVSSVTGIPESYLVLLKREAGSYQARPFPLSDFPGIPFEYTEILKSKGIRNTREFFEQVQTHEQQVQFSRQTGIPVARLEELYALSDLSRITGIGGVFARIVFEAGIRSVEQFATIPASQHYLQYMVIIKKRDYQAGHFSENDMQYCIDYARVILDCKDSTQIV
jgi:hypothetical protein